MSDAIATSPARNDSQFAVSRSEFGALVAQVFQKIDYRPPQPFQTSKIELVLTQYIQQQCWSDRLKARSVKYAKQAVEIASWYPRASFACQSDLVIMTFLMIFYDDEYATAGTDFCTRLVRGQPQETPFLDSLARYLQSAKPYLGPYGSSMFFISIIEFVESTKVEKEPSEYVPINAIRFPRYLRDKTGLPEAYAHALPTIPALCDIILSINDILSFYKETIRGTERVNYICSLAKTTGKSAMQCLQDTSDVLEKGIAEMRRVLKPHSALLTHANDYLIAYIHWHVRTISRYHLNEVMEILKTDVANPVIPVKPDVSTPVPAK